MWYFLIWTHNTSKPYYHHYLTMFIVQIFTLFGWIYFWYLIGFDSIIILTTIFIYLLFNPDLRMCILILERNGEGLRVRESCMWERNINWLPHICAPNCNLLVYPDLKSIHNVLVMAQWSNELSHLDMTLPFLSKYLLLVCSNRIGICMLVLYLVIFLN